MLKYDLVVVGGGPAGGTCAYFAAKLGIKTCLIERRKWCGIPVCCAEGISKTGLESILKPKQNWISSLVSGAHLFSPSGKKITIHHPDAGYILERRIMERDLLSLAASYGAEIFTQTTAYKITKKDGKFVGIEAVCDKQSFQIEAQFIALACGVDTSILSTAGINPYVKPSDLITSAQYLIAGAEIEKGYPSFYLGNEIAPGGYAWIFPKNDNLANVGVGVAVNRLNGKKAVDYLNRFLQEKIKGRFTILEKTGGIVPVAGPLKRLVYDNIVLIGDAGQLTDPFSGGGIANALLSGMLAAYGIYDAINDKAKLSSYEQKFFALKGRELETHLLARKILISLSDKELNELGNIVDELYGGKTFTAIDSIQFLKEIFLRHPKILVLARKIIPALFK